MILVAVVSVVVLACLFATVVGGAPERQAAMAMLVAQAGTVILVDRRDWAHVQANTFGIDLALLVVLMVLALSSHRFWPMWAAAFQAFNASMHLAFILDRRIDAWAYLTGTEIASFLVVAALVVGAWMEARPRTASGGPASASSTN